MSIMKYSARFSISIHLLQWEFSENDMNVESISIDTWPRSISFNSLIDGVLSTAWTFKQTVPAFRTQRKSIIKKKVQENRQDKGGKTFQN